MAKSNKKPNGVSKPTNFGRETPIPKNSLRPAPSKPPENKKEE